MSHSSLCVCAQLTGDLACGGLDTLHILAGVPSTSTLMDLAGVPLTKGKSENPLATRTFASSYRKVLPDKDGLDRVAAEARICGETNYVGTTLSLATFVYPSSLQKDRS